MINRRDFFTGAVAATIAPLQATAQSPSITTLPQTTQQLYDLYLQVANGDLDRESFSTFNEEEKKALAKSLQTVNALNAKQVALSHVYLEAHGVHNQGYVQYYMRDPQYMHGYANGDYTHQTGYADLERDMGKPINDAIQETGKLLLETIDENNKIIDAERLEEITDVILKDNVSKAAESVFININKILDQHPDFFPDIPTTSAPGTPSFDL